jgi:histidine triad (HIT) family protein
MSSCIFCKIVHGDLPSIKVFEDKDILVFKDIKPAAPVHVLVIPKEHFASLSDAQDKHAKLLGKMLLKIRDLAKQLNVHKTGYKIVINNGEGSGQIVFHLHIHLIGGWKKEAVGYKI